MPETTVWMDGWMDEGVLAERKYLLYDQQHTRRLLLRTSATANIKDTSSLSAPFVTLVQQILQKTNINKREKCRH